MGAEPALFVAEFAATNVRNLRSVSIALDASHNFFIGCNGSGKSSLLEAVHVLGTGRPLRGTRIESVISFGAESLLVRGAVRREGEDHRLGVERDRRGNIRARRNQDDVRSSGVLAEELPLVVFDPATIGLVAGPRSVRRKQLDWGVFHVERAFAQLVGQWRRVFAQRNAAVRQGVRRQAAFWDGAFVEVAEQIQEMRARYVAALRPLFSGCVTDLGLQDGDIELSPGWDMERGLGDVLDEAWRRDVSMGHSTRGPHRAELRVLHQGRVAGDVLSRGEQKLLAYALLLAQSKLLVGARGLGPVALVDDLLAELDQQHAEQAFNALAELGCQIWLTGVDADAIGRLRTARDGRVFHVEQGTVRETAA